MPIVLSSALLRTQWGHQCLERSHWLHQQGPLRHTGLGERGHKGRCRSCMNGRQESWKVWNAWEFVRKKIAEKLDHCRRASIPRRTPWVIASTRLIPPSVVESWRKWHPAILAKQTYFGYWRHAIWRCHHEPSNQFYCSHAVVAETSTISMQITITNDLITVQVAVVRSDLERTVADTEVGLRLSWGFQVGRFGWKKETPKSKLRKWNQTTEMRPFIVVKGHI